jgi:F-type H+-transporting ATPase subunit alpha
VAGRLKGELSQYRDLEAFSQFGSDLDEDTQKTLARGERLVQMLNQGERSPIPVEEQVAIVYAATNGHLDRISAERVEEFNEGLSERLRSSASDTLEKIRGGDWGDDTQKGLDDAIGQYASDFGYDLDEEGAPTDEEVPVNQRDGKRDADGSSDSDAEHRDDDTDSGGRDRSDDPDRPAAVAAGSAS